jgi:CRP-like cAMP-binding protein
MRAFTPNELEGLRPEAVGFARGETLIKADEPFTHFVFVEQGMVSLARSVPDGRSVDVGAVLPHGLAGASLLFLPTDHSPNDYVVRVAGTGYRVERDALRSLLISGVDIGSAQFSIRNNTTRSQRLLKRIAAAAISLNSECSACNRLHSVEQRCARSLLLALDASENGVIALTQEELSRMIGAQRGTIADNCLKQFRRDGIIRSGRGWTRIVDRVALMAVACECYTNFCAEICRVFG